MRLLRIAEATVGVIALIVVGVVEHVEARSKV